MQSNKKNKRFIDLSDKEIKQIAADIFDAVEVTNISRNKPGDWIICTTKTVWNEKFSGSKIETEDAAWLGNPWIYGKEAISTDYEVRDDALILLKQFCVANDIIPEWLQNNPYSKK